jgi:hypothetical protein
MLGVGGWIHPAPGEEAGCIASPKRSAVPDLTQVDQEAGTPDTSKGALALTSVPVS